MSETITLEQNSEGTYVTSEKELAPKRNYLAYAALAASISGFFLGFTFLLGVALGHYALYRISYLKKDKTGGEQAAWALIIGYFGILCFLIFIGSLLFAGMQYAFLAVTK